MQTEGSWCTAATAVATCHYKILPTDCSHPSNSVYQSARRDTFNQRKDTSASRPFVALFSFIRVDNFYVMFQLKAASMPRWKDNIMTRRKSRKTAIERLRLDTDTRGDKKKRGRQRGVGGTSQLLVWYTHTHCEDTLNTTHASSTLVNFAKWKTWIEPAHSNRI